MLLEELLYEKLGNLSQLKVGSMLNILKQSAYQKRRGGYEVGFTGNKFGGGGYSGSRGGFGSTSDIVDVGVIKGGIGGLRKAYKAHEDAVGFALYVGGKAVCFGKFTPHELAGSSRVGLFSYDLSQFKAEIDKQFQEKMDKRSDYEKKHTYNQPTPRKTSPYREEEPSSWDKEKGIKKRIFHGEARSTSELKDFIEELMELADNKPITCKLVLSDKVGNEKRKKRYHLEITKDELEGGLEALKVRLAHYKISKKPTAATIEEFLEKALKGTTKVLQFGGRGYTTTPSGTFDSDKVHPVSVLKGQPFSVRYTTVDPGNYDSIDITYVFNPDTGILRPFKAKWSDKERHSQEAALEPETYIKHELNIKNVTKDEILKSVLTRMKDGNSYSVMNLINAARKGGHDYPEFKTIEKSLAADKEKENED